MSKLAVGALAVLLLVTGCASDLRLVREGDRHFAGTRFALDLPLGWVQESRGDVLRVTRDGVGLELIEVAFKGHDKAFEKLKKTTSAEILPNDLAQLVIPSEGLSQGCGKGAAVRLLTKRSKSSTGSGLLM